MELGTIFTLDEYDEAYKFVSENGYTIEEIEPKGDERQFKIVEVSTPDLSYSEKRALEYPSIQDQLDMLYWDKVNGTNNWQETIADIKAKYPKEVEEEAQQPQEIAEEYPYTESIDIVD
jgi:hypothetical protein